MGWPVEFTRYTVLCTDCGAKSRVYFVDNNTQPLATPSPDHCPGCGSHATLAQDPDQDYWDVMSESYTREYREKGHIGQDSVVSPSLLQSMFELWHPDRRYSYGEFLLKAVTEPTFLDEVMA